MNLKRVFQAKRRKMREKQNICLMKLRKEEGNWANNCWEELIPRSRGYATSRLTQKLRRADLNCESGELGDFMSHLQALIRWQSLISLSQMKERGRGRELCPSKWFLDLIRWPDPIWSNLSWISKYASSSRWKASLWSSNKALLRKIRNSYQLCLIIKLMWYNLNISPCDPSILSHLSYTCVRPSSNLKY